MQKESVSKNLKVAMIFQITALLLNFIDRRLFIRFLGMQYLGVHSIFINVISMLSLVEMGIGSAIIYNLYEPLARHDEKTIAGLMALYKKFYFRVGCLIGLLGTLMIGAIPILVQDITIPMQEVRRAYLLFVAGTVGTYWTGYKRSILYADQKNYMLLLGDMSISFIGMFAKIGCLLFQSSYINYVILHVITNILKNSYAVLKVNRLYPYLKQQPTEHLEQEMQSKVIHNIKDLFIHKISEFVVMSTDNLILTLFLGVQAVAQMANYQLIMTAVLSFVGKGVEALQASIGNLVTTNSKEEVYKVYDQLNFISFWIASITGVCLMGLTEPFITLWLGQEYVLSTSILAVLVLNHIFCVLNRPLWQMMSVSGLFKQDKKNALAEMAVNLVISILLVQRLGILGVLIGTTCSWLVAWWLKSQLLYKTFFKKSIKAYYKNLARYTLLIIIELAISSRCIAHIDLNNLYLGFILIGIICVVLPTSLNCIAFRRNSYFIAYKERIVKMLKEQLKDSNSLDHWITKSVCLLMLLVPLHGSTLVIEPIGKVVSFLLIIGCLGYILWHVGSKYTNPKKIRYGLVVYMVLMGTLIISGGLTGRTAGIKAGLWIVMVTSVGVALSLMDWHKLDKGIFLVDIGILIWIVDKYRQLIIWSQTGSKSFKYIYNNPNFEGIMVVLMIMLLALCYSQKRGERYILYMLLLIPIMLATKCRTALLALAAFGIIYIVWYVTSRWQVAHYMLGVGILVSLVAIVFIYIQLGDREDFAQINQIVAQTTDKSLYSGREKLWLESLEFIRQKPIVGYGLQITLPELTGRDLNTHNEFLQILLQTGCIGITLMIGILINLWKGLYKVGKERISRIGASILVGILIIASFESILLGESITLGVLQWGLIGVGYSRYIMSIRKQDKEVASRS